MKINSETQALEILDDDHKGTIEREEAVRYLADFPSEQVIDRLVKALQDDDFGVRWESSMVLSGFEKMALPSLLKALIDPERVGDPRLRRGVLRVFSHMKGSSQPRSAWKLIDALRSPAADIASMEEAYKMLEELDAESPK
jgi:HEAT repeat protein